MGEGERLRLHFADGRVDALAEAAPAGGLFTSTEPTTPEAGA